MKTLKSLFMLCAGLSFCACSSDNEPQLPEGKAAISIKVALPNTRAEASPTGGEGGEEKVALEGIIYVKLTATNGGGVKAVDGEGVATFYGIEGPSKVEAFVNGGKYVYDNHPAINTSNNSDSDFSDGDDNYNMQAEASRVPAYGYVDITTGHLTQNSKLYEGVSYQMYEATVTMDILVARVEYTVTYDFTSSKFNNLDFQGAYLDNIKATPLATEYDYRHASDVDSEYNTTATGSEAILYDYPQNAIAVEGQSGSLPGDDIVYAYNIYSYDVPHFKLWFNGATSDTDYVVPYQYAVVNSYNSGALGLFTPGTIYRVTLSALNQDHLVTNEDGTLDGINYGIDVIVKQAKWDVADVTGEWSY